MTSQGAELHRRAPWWRRWLRPEGGAAAARVTRQVAAATAHEAELSDLDDDALRERADTLRGRPFDAAGSALWVALAREATRRTLDVRPFDTQLAGALHLLAGTVVEMATGEGKTLTGAIAAAGYAVQGRSVHVTTVNDYLARRDAEWMAPLFALLGVTVGHLGADSDADERRAAYAADVTYAAVTELGFDVLRDRLAGDPADLVVPEPDVIVLDEADSVLVDQARVPLVLAAATEAADSVAGVAGVVSTLRPGLHFEADDEGRTVHLTASGARRVGRALGGVDLYDDEHSQTTLVQVHLALHARALVHRDVDYIVADGTVRLVDQARGRVAALQRWPDGLHAAVEAKEGLTPTGRGAVLDSLTVQGVVGRYRTLCGMSGTAQAAEEQLRTVHDVAVAVVAPHVPCVRTDEPDRVYATAEQRDAAVVAEVVAVHATGQPVLLGTLDVAESERLAAELADAGVTAVVLNARNDADEAEVIARAGQEGVVTISTQMAGRGTDIVLGEGVRELGGLRVIAAGHHPNTRLDAQLRGRAGRQGDPGSSVVFASLADTQVRRFAAEDARPDETPDEDGRLRGSAARHLVAHAQTVEEGADQQLHTTTWRYSRLLEQQRAVLGRRRDELLRTDAGDELLARLRPERHAELVEEVGHDAVRSAARQIVLHELDRGWAEHLATTTDLRETIHLRALARLDPLDEFHRESIAVFAPLVADAEARAAEVLDTLKVVDGSIDLPAAGVARPTATWTYLVTDNPYGSELGRFVGGMARRARSRPQGAKARRRARGQSSGD